VKASSSWASASSARTPGAGSMIALTASPISGSGTPMTATSATAGCITRAFSIACG
jgi:hypothetical protein